MRRYVFFLLICLASAVPSLSAFESGGRRLFAPLTPRMSGMGNSIVSAAEGIESLYLNPASLAFEKGTFTVSSIVPTVFCEPQYAMELIDSLMSQHNPLSGVLLASKKMITSSGAGLSLSWGLGWTGNSWGIGLVSYVSGFFQGDPFPLGVTGTMDIVFALPIGGAVPFYLGDFGTLSIGMDIRPMVAYRIAVDGTTVDKIAGNPEYGMQVILDSFKTPYFAFSVDFGVRATFWKQLNATIVLRDVGTDFSAPGTGRPPLSNKPVLNAGISWSPEYRLFFLKFDPILSLDVSDIIGLADGRVSFWKSLHLGAELGINDIVYLRTGLNQGYLTLGASVDIFFLSFGVSFYTAEMGRYLGDNPLSGFSAEIAIKIR